MSDILLQVWGGGFYLLNKVFLSRAERSHGAVSSRWRAWSWAVYLVGLPAWVVIFVGARNWMAAGVESSGAAAMVLGLVAALKHGKRPPRWLDALALVGAAVGITYSLVDFAGLHAPSQWLELGVVIGFLSGTYLVAKARAEGYLCFLVMNLSAAALMWHQGFYWLFGQQLLSIAFIADAFLTYQRRRRAAPSR